MERIFLFKKNGIRVLEKTAKWEVDIWLYNDWKKPRIMPGTYPPLTRFQARLHRV
ncbi:hypothetical protein SAMN05421820_113203 [Pedobacter steynii]|uniref:Uncharacterized protein n=1 Tax=Pedobacter steynii TaxID=430522 RepID=A0A1H0IMD6_9SPHI|nr:hypothetical protein SAMN05421820_113203 [Pedobacter steynii]